MSPLAYFPSAFRASNTIVFCSHNQYKFHLQSPDNNTPYSCIVFFSLFVFYISSSIFFASWLVDILNGRQHSLNFLSICYILTSIIYILDAIWTLKCPVCRPIKSLFNIKAMMLHQVNCLYFKHFPIDDSKFSEDHNFNLPSLSLISYFDPCNINK